MTFRLAAVTSFVWFFLLNSLNAQVFPLFGNNEHRLQKRAERRLKNADEVFDEFRKLGNMGIDSVKVEKDDAEITIYLSPNVTHIPVRLQWVEEIEGSFRSMLGRRFRNYNLQILARNRKIREYIPNIYRNDDLPLDSTRIRRRAGKENPLVQPLSHNQPTAGLAGNHIALWHSHGNYYNINQDRWQWQRARLFTTVEDIFPTEYVIRYITPMLEKAGAVVLLPRERDFQSLEVIADNDQSTGDSELRIMNGHSTWITHAGGFAMKDTLFDSENPFEQGTHLVVEANSGSSLVYMPHIPKPGDYAVYISWAFHPQAVPDVMVTVNYSGGSQSFYVNQQMGSGTWVYLGTFSFEAGKDPDAGSVTIHTHSSSQGFITADAVRFGGGMGNVARRALPQTISPAQPADQAITSSSSGSEISWKLSGRPRFTEGARYYLQYAGMPDTLVYSFNEGRNDYNDDFMSRGEWVNYLMGAPLGPQRHPGVRGLKIPIDLSLAFHTDAGTTTGDTVIGTLAIYSAERNNGLFPDSISRMASRDLSDLIQSQIVDDIRSLYHPYWTRRAIWDRQYSEAWRPNVPAMLLELLSHQNLGDMRFGLDPQFQFDVSRAIYKGILRFIAFQEGREAIVQPLPPQAFALERTGPRTIRLSWQPAHDSLEPTARPEKYIIYTRHEGSGFDQGITVQEPFAEIELPQWNTIYSFQVTAINQGGESFPSEILSATMVPGNDKMVLIVNGFNKISGPGIFDREMMEGLDWWDNHAIPYKASVSFTGQQYDFDRNSAWLDDDSPGWGASYANYEGRIVAGNSFDYPFIHGQSVRNAGYSFVSVSRQAFEEGYNVRDDFFAINLVMGKQKGTPGLMNPERVRFRVFTPAMISRLNNYARSGGNILISGAYIGTDSRLFNDRDAIDFAHNILGYSWRTSRATNVGQVRATDQGNRIFLSDFDFETQPNEKIYHVEAPDAIEPAGAGSRIVFRYGTNAASAAVLHQSQHKAFSMGVPFEAITDPLKRDNLMKRIMLFFENNTP
jgi:hypothetical protein